MSPAQRVFLSLLTVFVFAGASLLTIGLAAGQELNPYSDDRVSENAPVLDPFVVYEWAASGSSCGLRPELLGAVGAVVSDHGLFEEGAGYSADGTLKPALYGERGDGSRVNLATLFDTDFGAIDADDFFDRPVGPLQLLPISWRLYGEDSNLDGVRDPQNLWDASAAAADFLCAMGAGPDGDNAGAVRFYTGSDEQSERVLDFYDDLILVSVFNSSSEIEDGESDVVPNPDDSESDVGPDLDDSGSDGEKLDDDASDDPYLSLLDGPKDESEMGDPSEDRQDEDEDEDEDEDDGTSELRFVSQTADQTSDEGEQALLGDWNGDGVKTEFVWEVIPGRSFMEMSPIAVGIPLDEHGRPYGAQVRVEVSRGAEPLVGDWNGDGFDSLAIRNSLNDEVDVVEFYDRYGNVEGPSVVIGSDEDVEDVWRALRPDPAELTFFPRPDDLDDEQEEASELGESIPDRSLTAANGQDIELVRVEGILVNAEIAEAVEVMIAHAREDGVELTGWGWRSNERQIELRTQNCADPWETPSSECSPPTARPGHSRHELGLAIDFHHEGRVITRIDPAFIWLQQHAGTYGLFNLPSEPWHWSVDGR